MQNILQLSPIKSDITDIIVSFLICDGGERDSIANAKIIKWTIRFWIMQSEKKYKIHIDFKALSISNISLHFVTCR